MCSQGGRMIEKRRRLLTLRNNEGRTLCFAVRHAVYFFAQFTDTFSFISLIKPFKSKSPADFAGSHGAILHQAQITMHDATTLETRTFVLPHEIESSTCPSAMAIAGNRYPKTSKEASEEWQTRLALERTGTIFFRTLLRTRILSAEKT